MRNYIKLLLAKVNFTRSGGILVTTRYLLAADDQDLLEQIGIGIEFYRSFAPDIDSTATVLDQVLYLKMNKENVVRALRANNLVSNNYLGNDVYLIRPTALGTSEWADELKDLFVDTSPRKKEIPVHHG